MTSGRGIHHTDETQVLPGPGEPSTAEVDTDDDKTPPIWWIKTIASWTLLAAAVALLAVLVVIPRLTGSTAYTVLTGSMQPTYPPGTLIVVKPTPGDQLKAGDVITFQPKSGDPSVTTHRIVSIVYDAKGERKFVTKGDANNAQDEPIVEGQVRGRLLYSVPYLGRLNSLLSGSSRSILVFLIAGALGAYALWMWISSIRDRKKPKDDEPPADEHPVDPQPIPDAPLTENLAPVASIPAAPASLPSMLPARHAAPEVPVCHACGAPQREGSSGGPPLAYSAVTDPMGHSSSPAAGLPSTEVTRPIPVQPPTPSHN
ncbi:signal peptidase I [Gordonia neofelifaecis]|uniref:Signal peptidase I n=1 Tax=Gordonia neofelifaecis NRRL B-59395 TaxID=644548 RepID=F1YJP2_9ACTN|nr:signal peptidase I [Gordonia neofelifaecis]EGD54974.1 signal peptidase I [Gordonia neofelifaecis NRRL B-59395]